MKLEVGMYVRMKNDACCEFLMNKINELIDEIDNLKREKHE